MNPPTAKRYASVLLAWVLLTTILVSSCSDNDSSKPDPNARAINIYSATIESVALHMGASVEKTDKPLLIFVNALADDPITAEVQLGVVLALEDWASIRFIDDFEEAIDFTQPQNPPKNDGMLIGIGNFSSGGTSTRVYADIYISDQETWVFDVALVLKGGEWQLDEPLQPTVVPGAVH